MTKQKVSVFFLWTPTFLGGHPTDPYVGMRLTIRWQFYVEAYLKLSRDVQCESLSFNIEKNCWQATFFFISEYPIPDEWLKKNELIELLNGYKVLAIGKIA